VPEIARAALRKSMGMNVETVPSGALLTGLSSALPVGKPLLLVSLARSGDSPESVRALAVVRELEPDVRHLVLTCNREGNLAKTFRGDPKVRVITMCETFLGLRHGPMRAVDGATLVVCFLSSDPMVRLTEADVLKEMDQKRLGLARIIAGDQVSPSVACAQDLVVSCECPDLIDEDLPALDVIVGQLLAFFRCLHEGLRPDSPSDTGVIRRVVPSFALYPPQP
jgi:fructoselysine-6-P-deglycase FrlB-like protein